jgi:hypothetical protein
MTVAMGIKLGPYEVPLPPGTGMRCGSKLHAPEFISAARQIRLTEVVCLDENKRGKNHRHGRANSASTSRTGTQL